MKKIVLILVSVIAFSCKKKDVTPTQVEPVCETAAIQFEGKYHLNNYGYDTIEVVFLHNNCPTKNSNTYLVKGLGKAVQPMLKANTTFEVKDYEITVDESISKGVFGNIFSLGRESTGDLIFSSSKIQTQTVGFQKI